MELSHGRVADEAARVLPEMDPEAAQHGKMEMEAGALHDMISRNDLLLVVLFLSACHPSCFGTFIFWSSEHSSSPLRPIKFPSPKDFPQSR